MDDENTKSLNLKDVSRLHGTVVDNFSSIVDPRVLILTISTL